MTQPDFGGVEVAPPAPHLLANLAKLVNDLRLLQERQAAAQRELEQVTADLNRLQLVTIPDAMQEVGLSEFKLTDGAKLVVKDGLNASISQDNARAAYAWLRANGHGSIIREEVTVDARGLEPDTLEDLNVFLASRHIEAARKESVHAATLKALMKDVLEKGINPPPVFGIHQFKKADVKEPKK